MATIKLKYRPSMTSGKEGALYYQVIHRRAVRQVKTNYHILPEEWDEEESRLITSTTNIARRAQLQLIMNNVNWDIQRMTGIIIHKENCCRNYTIDDLMDEFSKMKPCQSVFNYMMFLISKLEMKKQYGTARTYITTLRSFRKFRNDVDLSFDELDADVIEMYESYLRAGGLVRNTTSFYMRILRTVYHIAVENGLASHRDIFKRVYTGFDRTAKRAISIEYIKRIKKLDLSFQPSLEFARDLFLLSFYMRGMPFVDMAYLKKSDLKNGYVSYNRMKTRQHLVIGWERLMEDVVERYSHLAEKTPYLLPIITRTDGTERRQYQQAQHRINRNLKVIGNMVGLNIPLTMYVARHSWASVAHGMKIPISIISEGMGHDSEKTTQTYLASLNTSVIDKANKKILRGL